MTIKIQVSSDFAAPLAATTQIVTIAGTTAVLTSTTTLIFNKAVASPSPCNLPSGVNRGQIPLDIYDFSGLAGDITLTPNGTEKIMGANAPWVITSGGIAQSGGHQRLTYFSSIPGWVVQ